MRVVHVDTERGWRGGQTQLLHLATATSADCAVVCPPDAPLAVALRGAQVDVRGVPFSGRWRGTRRLARVLRELKPDLVASHTSHAAAHVARVRWPWVAHRRLDFAPSRTARGRLGRARGIVAVSGAVARVLGRAGVDTPIRVVHDGVEHRRADPEVRGMMRARLGLHGQESLVVCVGALVDHKGHRFAVRALSWLPGVHLAILGEGHRRSDLLALAHALGVAPRLHLIGQSACVPKWLAAADVFCHPSVEEGLGQAVIEALLASTPVVATRAGGVAEVVEDLGVLVPPQRPRALAAAIQQVQGDPQHWRRRCQAAHATLLQRFGVDAMVQGTVSAYQAFVDMS